MKGQISIDYLAGALIFFGSLVFLVSNVMTALPQFSQAQQRDELTLSAWSISEVMMEDRGYWENATHSGEDWHKHVGDVEVLGLKGERGLSGKKVGTLLSMDASEIRSALQTGKKVNVELKEVVDVDTHRAFQRDSSPDFLTEPSYQGETASEVHYGSKRIGGEELYFLLTQNPDLGWYNRLRTSRDWDFSTGTELYNLTETQYIPVGNRTYVVSAGNTQISGGKLLVMWRQLGRAGDIPDESVEDVVSVERYGVMDGNVVEVTFRVWE
ncbi:MAG: hypothetical protein SVS85_00955 [Candidatus Nanohaloarchaea archaeon]|nr:hypothetical protein [Candidatus Nanohaloarchaea archaeon]